MLIRKAIIVVVLVLWLHSCKRENENYSAKSYEYIPYEVGNERYYRVDSVIFGLDTIIRISKNVLETVTEKFADLQGQTNYRLEQFELPDSNKNPIFFDLQSMTWNGQGMQRWENNTRYLKMIFPIREKKQWNGNMFNNLGTQMYQFTAVSKPLTIGTTTYTDVVSITQRLDTNYTYGYHDDREYYAKGIGLIYRTNQHIEIDQNPPYQKTGYEVIWTLTKFRKQ